MYLLGNKNVHFRNDFVHKVIFSPVRFRDEERMTKDNTTGKTNQYVRIYIDMWDEIFFSCPNPVQKDWVSSVLTHPDYLFENMWVVSKKEFDSCTLDESSWYTREMLRCDSVRDYTEVKYRKMRVRPIADGTKSIEFHAEQTYYLIGERAYLVMFCQNTGNINPRFVFDIETAKSVILLCIFLSCRKRV